ncbi:MAG: RNA 2',3'-cyclic phosphodiesterase [Deltaproteobacteria bacterium]|nr:RNA 2',3'-cyclic phosphodiesterase [Deltaproteobacteria bacterium]
MRLFFAVTLEEAAAQAVVDVQLALRRRYADPGVRWVGRDQLHYTLKFLGEVDPDRVAECAAAARKAVVGTAPIQLDLCALGAFPSRRSARVIWIGTSTGAELVGALAQRLDQELVQVGFQPEPRPFTPHLTIARVKGPAAERAAARLLETERLDLVATTRIDAMVLMRSELSPRGATYRVVDRFLLGDRDDRMEPRP